MPDPSTTHQCTAQCRAAEADQARDRLTADLDQQRTRAETAETERDERLTLAESSTLARKIDKLEAESTTWKTRLVNETARLREHLNRANTERQRLAEELATLDNRVRLLLVTPEGDRQDHDTITIAQLRNAINGDTTSAKTWIDCAGCGDTVYPGERIYPAPATPGHNCVVCEVKRAAAAGEAGPRGALAPGLGSSRRAQDAPVISGGRTPGPRTLVEIHDGLSGLLRQRLEELPADTVSSVISVSNRFARAAANEEGGADWVRLHTGSGRQYEGYRSPDCPGDGVTGHQHDIRCVTPEERP